MTTKYYIKIGPFNTEHETNEILAHIGDYEIIYNYTLRRNIRDVSEIITQEEDLFGEPIVDETKDVGITIESIFVLWQTLLDKQKAKLTTRRRRVIFNALQTYTQEQIESAIRGCYKSDFHMGRDKRSTGKFALYNDLTLILRNPEKIDFFIELNERTYRNGKKLEKPIIEQDIPF